MKLFEFLKKRKVEEKPQSENKVKVEDTPINQNQMKATRPVNELYFDDGDIGYC